MTRASHPLGVVTQSARPFATLTTRRTEMLASTAPVKSARVNCEVPGSQNAGSLVGGTFTLHSCTTTFEPGLRPVARTRVSWRARRVVRGLAVTVAAGGAGSVGGAVRCAGQGQADAEG